MADRRRIRTLPKAVLADHLGVAAGFWLAWWVAGLSTAVVSAGAGALFGWWVSKRRGQAPPHLAVGTPLVIVAQGFATVAFHQPLAWYVVPLAVQAAWGLVASGRTTTAIAVVGRAALLGLVAVTFPIGVWFVGALVTGPPLRAAVGARSLGRGGRQRRWIDATSRLA